MMKVLFLDTVHPILAERLSAGRNGSVSMAHHTPRLEALVPTDDAAGIVLRSKIRVDCRTA